MTVPISSKKTLFSILSIIAIFGYVFLVFAAAPAGGYAPGSTLDPDCAPNDPDCIVSLPTTGGLLSADNGLSVIGSNVQFGGELIQRTQIKQNDNDLTFIGGKIGIGTDSPGFTLDIGGNSQYATSNVTFSGDLDDLSVDTGGYVGTTSISYNLYVSNASDPDEISWTDDRGNSGRFQLYGSTYPLSYGVLVTFSNLTGHAGNESWTFSITKTDAGILNVSEQINIGGNFFATQNGNNSTFLGTGVDVLRNLGGSFFVGADTGRGAEYSDYSNFIGYSAGSYAMNAPYSNFIGQFAGYGATYAANSNFFGQNAGNFAVNSNNANFIGTKAGLNADSSYDSNFIGHNAGNGAHSYQSNFIGLGAGKAEKFGTNVQNSNFIGTFAGFDATSAYQSNFIGYQAGYQARGAANSIFIGQNAGYADLVDNSSGGWSILIGDNTSTGGFSNSIAFGGGAFNTTSNQFALADSITDIRLAGIDYILPTTQGNSGDVLTNDGFGNLIWSPGGGSGGGAAWNLIGNTGTNPKDNFIGTTDEKDFVMKTNNLERARVLSNGNFGINTSNATAILEVRGSTGFASGYVDFVTYGGTGLNDINVSGTYTGADNCTINVNINSVSPDNGLSNDTFVWQYVSGPCSGGSGGQTEITPDTPYYLIDGISVTFSSSTGHENKAGWDINVVYGLTTPDTFSVISNSNNNYLRITSNGSWNINDVLYQMPTVQASNPGDVLTNDGSGNLVWAAPGALTVNVTNGLGFIGGDIGLGGKLTQNTTIDGDANLNSLAFNELNLFGVGKTNIIEFGANERISLSSSDLTTISAKSALTLSTDDGPLYIKTKNVNAATAINGQVLTLIDASTGETEWQNATSSGAGLQWYAENVTAPTVAPVATGSGSIALGDNAEALESDMFVYGKFAGLGATHAISSIFIGSGAGSAAVDSSNAVFIGNSAGGNATSAYNSNFIGAGAGYEAINAVRSNFIGQDAGNGATDASNSNFFGLGSGNSATNALRSNFFGMNSGVGAANAANSIFIGTNAGANDAVNNTATYDDAATFANTSILIGHNTSTGGFSNSIAFGAYATNTAANQLQIGSTSRFIRSVFIGDSKGTASVNDTFFVGRGAGSNATNASFSIFLGQGSGQNATSATGSSFIGRSAGSNATNASNSSFIGLNAGLNATGASSSNFMGRNAGSSASAASEATFIGNNAGRDATNAAYSTFLGTGAGFGAINARNSIIIGAGAGQDSVLNNTGNSLDYSIIIGNAATADGFSNSIALGAYATNTASNQFMIGSTTRTIDTTIWKGSASTTCTLTTGTGMACSSDERLKTNIIGLTTDTLDKLLNVKTVTYNWLQNPTSKTQIGFLAQDLEQYFPELVATDSNGMKSVYYSQMTPILVEAIREMNLKIITLNDMTQPNTWRDSLIAWMGNVENGIGQFVAGTIKARNQVCIDDVCMTKNQLRTLLENNGMHTTPTVSVSTPVVTDTTSAGDVSSNDTSGDNTVTDSVTTVDSSTGTGDVPPVGTE